MGILDSHVIESLKKYTPYFSIIFVSDGKIKMQEKKNKFCRKDNSKKHNEMDFGSWKLGINYLKNKQVENLILVNDSIIGPFEDIKKLIDGMKQKSLTFGG